MLARGSTRTIALPVIASAALLILAMLFEERLFVAGTAVFLAIAAVFIFFFRDPERRIAEGVVSAADGRIQDISEESATIKISTFMNLHNVHVNRAPLDGVVKSVIHADGKHVPAFRKDADTNENVVIALETTVGEVKIIQIAGSFARRIVPYVNAGETVKKGQRIGLIRFGSRVDVYVPKKGFTILVKKGQKVKAGETPLGRYQQNADEQTEYQHEDKEETDGILGEDVT